MNSAVSRIYQRRLQEAAEAIYRLDKVSDLSDVLDEPGQKKAGFTVSGFVFLCIATLIVIAVTFGFDVLTSLWEGYVIAHLWNWFMVPIGFPQIGIMLAVGIAVLVAFLTKHAAHRNSRNLEYEEIIRKNKVTGLLQKRFETKVEHHLRVFWMLLHTVAQPGYFLLVGYLIHNYGKAFQAHLPHFLRFLQG